VQVDVSRHVSYPLGTLADLLPRGRSFEEQVLLGTPQKASVVSIGACAEGNTDCKFIDEEE
jgi:hypothetical protein